MTARANFPGVYDNAEMKPGAKYSEVAPPGPVIAPLFCMALRPSPWLVTRYRPVYSGFHPQDCGWAPSQGCLDSNL